LAHGEALLIVSTGNAHDATLKLFSEDGTINFLGHAALIEILKTLLVINLHNLLHTSAWAGNINLFWDGVNVKM
jgi:hypothetical protein